MKRVRNFLEAGQRRACATRTETATQNGGMPSFLELLLLSYRDSGDVASFGSGIAAEQTATSIGLIGRFGMGIPDQIKRLEMSRYR